MYLTDLHLTIDGNPELNAAASLLQKSGYVVVADHEVALLRGQTAIDLFSLERIRSRHEAREIMALAARRLGSDIGAKAVEGGFFVSTDWDNVATRQRILSVDLYTIKPTANVPRRVVADYGDINRMIYS